MTHHAFTIRENLINRKNRRLFARESKKYLEYLGEIEIQFLTELFESDKPYSLLLQELEDANIILHKWLQLKNNRFKFILPNPKYLYEKYKALENAYS